MGKNPSVIQETWVRCLRWYDPLEEGLATVHRVVKNQTQLSN